MEPYPDDITKTKDGSGEYEATTHTSHTCVWPIVGVHTTLLAWVVPFLMLASVVPASLLYGTLTGVKISAVYAIIRLLSENYDLAPQYVKKSLERWFMSSFLQYFRMTNLTPTLFVSKRAWTRPQVVMIGPHGVFNMGGFRSFITDDMQPKNIVCAIDSAMQHSWFQPILRMAGSDGMIPLRHSSIEAEMWRAGRDLVVIPGGFVETNTGSEHTATMDTSKWAYWIVQCMRHGYDASFQWVYGGTQVFHTGDKLMGLRAWMGRRGVPFVFPRGKYGLPVARNDVPMAVAGFRMKVPHMPGVSRSAPEVAETMARFEARVATLLRRNPPQAEHAPVSRL